SHVSPRGAHPLLHDALPISRDDGMPRAACNSSLGSPSFFFIRRSSSLQSVLLVECLCRSPGNGVSSCRSLFLHRDYQGSGTGTRSEEHTSELQAPDDLVCRP